MTTIRHLVFTLLFAFACSFLHAAAPEWTPGRYDSQIVDALNTANKTLKIHQTLLKDVAPQYYVAADTTLSWDDALAVATKQYADDPIKNALYLVQFMKKGDPVSRLEKLHPGLGVYIGTGSGYFGTINIDTRKPEEIRKPPVEKVITRDGREVHVLDCRFPPARTPVAISIGKTNESILGCGIVLQDPVVGGVSYDRLSFDTDGKLRGFSRKIELPDSQGELEISTTTGEGGADAYYGAVRNGKQGQDEIIFFNGGMELSSRNMTTADSQYGYDEQYTNGKLAKRTWYKVIKSEQSARRVIDRTETL